MNNTAVQDLSDKQRLDRAGIICSVVCATHCSLPLIIGLISPNLSSYFENELIHFLLLIIVIPLALTSFLKGKKTHKSVRPMLLGSLGSLVLLIAVLTEHYFDLGINRIGFYLTLIGSFTLIYGHLLNIVLTKKSFSI